MSDLNRYMLRVDKSNTENKFIFTPYKQDSNELIEDFHYYVSPDKLFEFIESVLHERSLDKKSKYKYYSINFVHELIDVGASDSPLWDGMENLVFKYNRKKDRFSCYMCSICWDEGKVRPLSCLDSNRLCDLLTKLSLGESLLPDSFKLKLDEKFSRDLGGYEECDEDINVEPIKLSFGEAMSENFAKKHLVGGQGVENVDSESLEDLDKANKVESDNISEVKYRKTNLKGLDLSGKLISFEGGEGSGKTSQIKRLVWDLEKNGYDVLSLREPGGSKIAEEIREVILKKDNKDMGSRCEALCFAAARAQLMEEVIEPALLSGKVIILDRYVDSSYVYQGLVRGVGLDNVVSINNFATGSKETDLTIYLDVSPEVGFKRISDNNRETNKFEEVDMSFHERVRENYQSLVKEFNSRMVLVNGDNSIDEVYKSITSVLKSRFKPSK